MAPARAAAVSICTTTSACSLLAPQPKSLLTYSMSPQLVALLALLGSGCLFPRSRCPGFASLASRSLLSASLFNKKTQKTANMMTKTNGSRTFVNRINVHIYINDSTANHSYVAVFLLTLVVIWTVMSPDWRLPPACRYHPRLKKSTLRANTQS